MEKNEMDTLEFNPIAITKLVHDLKKAAVTLSRDEARFLVDDYYLMQEQRIRSGQQAKAMIKFDKPHEILNWFNGQADGLEKEVAKALDVYSNSFVLGRWARSQYGIGPILAAGLLAHIKIEKAPTVGHIWSYAGLNPTAKWGKKELRPWNASLRTLCWKIGESFSKTCNRDEDVYGHILVERKALETAKNEAGEYAEQAKISLAKLKDLDSPTAKANQSGKLSEGHIHSRSRRYAVKLFLAHYHHVAYELQYNTLPPKPYVIEHGGHTHYIAPPNWPLSEKIPDGLQLLP